MTQCISKSVVVAEIQRRRKEWWWGSSTEAKFKREECDDILSFLDTLEVKDVQEESVSEDLEEAANDYAHDLVHDDVFENFIAGAQWQKEQMMNNLKNE